MKSGETIQVAFSSLRANKLRSSLTILGIIIGIFSIISVSTVIAMLQNSIESGLNILGKDTFQIQRFPALHMGHLSDKIWSRKKITIDQFYRLRDTLKEARYVSAELDKWGIKAKSRWAVTNPNNLLWGITPETFYTNQIQVAVGRPINQNDLDYSTHVCILGTDLAKKLFKRVDPLNQEVRVENLRLKVIGVFEARGQIFGHSRDDFLAIPLTVFLNEYGKYSRSIDISVMAHGPQNYNATIEAAIGTLRAIRKVPVGEDNDFEIFSNESLIAQLNNITKYVRLGSILVALIALLAAGVGIMNIMLVSVTERTREIGIRKAIGAKKRNILFQFLVEAITLCQVGGVIGIILGLLVGTWAGTLLKVAPIFPLGWVIAGIMLCIVVGVAFGTYPAYKAAKLDPIEALRYE